MSEAFITRRSGTVETVGVATKPTNILYSLSVPELAGKKRWMLLLTDSNYSAQSLDYTSTSSVTVYRLRECGSSTYMNIFALYYNDGVMTCVFESNGTFYSSTNTPISINENGTISGSVTSDSRKWVFYTSAQYEYFAY